MASIAVARSAYSTKPKALLLPSEQEATFALTTGPIVSKSLPVCFIVCAQREQNRRSRQRNDEEKEREKEREEKRGRNGGERNGNVGEKEKYLQKSIA
jgi:hypothetical protein